MSIVIAYAMENFILMMSDGRISNKTTRKISHENCQKIIKINQNVLIGCTGSEIMVCDRVIRNLRTEDLENKSLEQVRSIVHASLKMELSKPGFNGVTANFVVGGLSETGEITAYAFSSKNGLAIDTIKPKGDGIEYFLFNDSIDRATFEQWITSRYPESIDDLVSLLSDVIYYVADRDFTVNKVVFTELITK